MLNILIATGIALSIYVVLWLYNVWAGYRIFHTPMYEGGLADEDGGLASGFLEQPSIFMHMLMAFCLPATSMWIRSIWWSFFPPQLPKFRDVKPVQGNDAWVEAHAINLPEPLPPEVFDE
jgi:hypothetical protein